MRIPIRGFIRDYADILVRQEKLFLWNPVRLIQRFGRIDRIGSEYDLIYGFNFLPETGIEKNLGLKERLRNRIQEIHDTIGEDSAILDRSEKLNEEAMYAVNGWCRNKILPVPSAPRNPRYNVSHKYGQDSAADV